MGQCASSVNYCSTWARDMHRCCPVSCSVAPVCTAEACEALIGKGTCTFPNAPTPARTLSVPAINTTVAIRMIVQGINYSSLLAMHDLSATLKREVRRAFARGTNVPTGWISVQLYSGDVGIEATITTNSDFENSLALGDNAALLDVFEKEFTQTILAIDGIDSVMDGAISIVISEVGATLTPTLGPTAGPSPALTSGPTPDCAVDYDYC